MSNASGSVALGGLEPGAIGTLDTFDAAAHHLGEEMVNRLREMGFAEGLEVEFLHQSLFGKDPIAIRVDGMTVALRRAEANIIKVQL
jgi:ferrous iron transport protein A